MKIKYVVRITTYCMDGSHMTHWFNFGTDLLSARRFETNERNRKLLPCDIKRVVRFLTVPA